MNIFLLINIAFVAYFIHAMITRQRSIVDLISNDADKYLKEDFRTKINSEIIILMLDYSGFFVNALIILLAIFK